MPSRPPAALVISAEQRDLLASLSKSQTEPHRLVLRARVLLLASEGLGNTVIAKEVGVSRSSVISWRQRFGETGVKKLGKVRPGRGRKPTIAAERVEAIVADTLRSKPEGETHWSCRSMARHARVSSATVQRIWSARGLRPHLVQTFKLSNDKRFEQKLVDVVGLYLDPPKKSVVLCVDEKSQIQALNRTQASLPMKKGRAGTMTHDYKRNGTTTLFAALDVATGAVIGKCLPRHRHGEFLQFLRLIDKDVPRGLAVHLIVDNYGTHNHENVQIWLAKHPRIHLHFIPTSSSWLNLVERWFREITDKVIRRGSFTSVPELIAAIERYLVAHNNNPKPFVWTATAESILKKVKRGRVTLAELTTG
ncbi:MAG: IS630 family transposase [Actinomycetota bacterium]